MKFDFRRIEAAARRSTGQSEEEEPGAGREEDVNQKLGRIPRKHELPAASEAGKEYPSSRRIATIASFHVPDPTKKKP